VPATKDQIATRFMELVLSHGYRRAAVEDVARELHISKKTIYEHFASKQDLLRYGLELWAREQRARVEARLTATTSLGRLEETVGLALSDARRAYETSRSARSIKAPDLTAQVNDLVFGPMVRGLLVAGVEAGEFEVLDPAATTSFVMAMGTEAVRMIRDDPSCHPEGALIDAVRRLVGRASVAHGGDAGGRAMKAEGQ